MLLSLILAFINLRDSFQAMTQGVGKGKGHANPMGTKWGNMDPGGRNDEWGSNEWKEGNIIR